MKKLKNINLYLLIIFCIVLVCIIGILQRPFPDLINDTATRIIQGVLLVIAIICYLIQTNKNNEKDNDK